MSLSVIVALLVGLAGGFAFGWYSKTRWGADLSKVETDIKQLKS